MFLRSDRDSGCPAAAATEAASARMAEPTPDPPGAAATSPTVPRSRQVSAPIDAMKTHLLHMAETMSAETSTVKPASDRSPAISVVRAVGGPSCSPMVMLASGPSWTIVPSASQGRRDHDDPAEHPLRAEPLVQHPHVIDPVEEWHNGGVRADRRREVIQGLRQSGRLDGKQDQVEGTDEIPGRDDLGVDDVVVALSGHPQPALAQHGGPLRPDQERDVPPALGEQRSEEAAGGPGADNEDVAAAWRGRLGSMVTFLIEPGCSAMAELRIPSMVRSLNS